MKQVGSQSILYAKAGPADYQLFSSVYHIGNHATPETLVILCIYFRERIYT